MSEDEAEALWQEAYNAGYMDAAREAENILKSALTEVANMEPPCD